MLVSTVGTELSGRSVPAVPDACSPMLLVADDGDQVSLDEGCHIAAASRLLEYCGLQTTIRL